MAKPLIYKNKIGIDTGCVDGNVLTSISFDKGDHRFMSISSSMNSKLTHKDLYEVAL